MPEDEEQGAESPAGHTSVVYVHGMGEQRRYEEVSRLVDALDGYAYWASHVAGKPVGILTRIRARLEEPRGDQKRDVSYIRVCHNPDPAKRPAEVRTFRFYEVYWAPLTAGGRSVSAVLRWLLRQIVTPLAVLRSPWRDRQRLRRASLHGLWEEMRQRGYGSFRSSTFAALLRTYNAFERADARRDFRRGTYSDFRRFLNQQHGDHPEHLRSLLALAGRWRNRALRGEALTALVLITLGVTLALGLGGLALAVSAATGALLHLAPGALGSGASWLARLLATSAAYGRSHLLEVVAALVSVSGIAGFLRNYLGDVEIWTTYQETDADYRKRREILESAAGLLRHVLEDPKCTRVVVVAHSLGTAIASDALLEVGRYNRARQPGAPMLGPLELEKLDHIVTLGSPIDKIHYFFESRTGSYHRYNRVVEEVRGDIGEVPFTKNRKPHMHWVNFWDAADIVSGPLESVSNPRNPYLRVDNVRTRSFRFPDPAASHSAYFQHHDVIGRIFEMIFGGGGSLRGFAKTAKDEEELEHRFLGPGDGPRSQRLIQGVALLVPWIVVAGLAASAFTALARAATTCYWCAAMLLGVLALGWAGGKLAGHLAPLAVARSAPADEPADTGRDR